MIARLGIFLILKQVRVNPDRNPGQQRLRAVGGGGSPYAVDDLEEFRCVAEHPSSRLVVIEQEVAEFVGESEAALHGVERAVEEDHANAPPGHQEPVHRAVI